MAIFELRIYEVLDCKMDDWVTYMEQVIIPYQTDMGMRITKRYSSSDGDQTYVWMREYDSMTEYKKLTRAVYGSEKWKVEMGPMARSLINVDTMRVETLVEI